jgi:hypothetical protein
MGRIGLSQAILQKRPKREVDAISGLVTENSTDFGDIGGRIAAPDCISTYISRCIFSNLRVFLLSGR